MRRCASLAAVLLALFTTSGCITFTNVVRVKPTGSGTLETTILFNTAMLKEVGSMMGGETRTEGKSKVPSPEELSQELSKVKGLRLVSQTPIKEGGAEGVRVLMAFDDVNQISVSENLPGKSLKPDPKDEVTFALTHGPGGNAVLSIAFPDRPGKAIAKEGKKDAAEAPAKKADPAMLKMVQGFLKGLRVMIAVDVDGTLVRTSSPYVEGNRVTLLDFNMDELLKDPAALERIGTVPMGPDSSITELREAMAKAGVKGLKVNDPKVTIEFK